MRSRWPLERELLAAFAAAPPELRRRARLLSLFGLVCAVAGLLLFVAHVVLFEIEPLVAAAPLASGVLALLAPAVAARTRSIDAGVHTVTTAWLVATAWGVAMRGGVASPPLMCMCALPFIATSLAGRRAGVIWVGVIVAVMAGFLGLDAGGVKLPDRLAGDRAVGSNIVAAAMFGGMLILMSAALEWLRLTAQREFADAEASRLQAQSEAQLLRADRLAALGQLAASLAHEINNPLVYVMGNLEFLARELPEDPEISGALRDAMDGAQRVRTIVSELKTFARNDEPRVEEVDLHKVVASSLRMVHGEVKHRARLRTELGPCPLVRGASTQLGQILVNLVVNAAQAIPEDGLPHEVVVSLGTDEGGRVALAVRDDGKGIPADILPRVTEPFFTTKPAGVGTGLGLAVCANLVRRHGGTLEIDSREGAGTTVTVRLPGLARSSLESTPAARAPSGPTERLAVLIVDDDEAVGRALARALSPHEVTVASGGREAIDHLRGARRFDLILCDVMMPGVDGVDVAAAATGGGLPAAGKLVFMTGGATTERARTFLAGTAHPVLIKPLEPDALALLLVDAARQRRHAAPS